MPAFDFHTLSLTIDSTLEEYSTAGSWPGASILGLNIGEVAAGDRSMFLRFRHEHAHFTSFAGSGLIDLYGILSDYVCVLCYIALREKIEVSSGTLRVPVCGDHSPEQAALRSAYQQVNQVRALLFGFGTRTPRGALLRSTEQDEFWRTHYEARFQRIIARYYDLLTRLSRAPRLMTEDEASGPALPIVNIEGRPRPLTARAVMEAYAITIELAATHLRSLESNLTYYGRPTVRQPGPLYTVALQHLLERHPWPRPTRLEEFLAGRAPLECYYVVPILTFAAMQVPVLQALEGSVLVRGDLRSLSIAHALHHIVTSIADGDLPPPPPNLRSAKNADQELIDWITTGRRHLEDEATAEIYAEVRAAFDHDERLQTMNAESQTISELAWAARANFLSDPTEYVLDAGLYAERHPCQPRFVRTSDNQIAVLGNDARQEYARYIAEHAIPILEAAVFGQQWDSTWAKLPEVTAENRPVLIQAAIVGIAAQFNDLDTMGDPPPVKVSPSL